MLYHYVTRNLLPDGTTEPGSEMIIETIQQKKIGSTFTNCYGTLYRVEYQI